MSETPHHVAADQEAVFAFLADPATHGLGEPVKRIDTHAAAVFLAGRDAYKVKRAIKFPFMDFSTLDKRRAGCEAEVAVNRRYASELYLGVMPITRAGGRLRLGGDGEVVEWLVHLRRFDETMTLDHVAERGGLTPALIGKVAARVLATYAEAERRDGKAATAALGTVLDETLAELSEAPEVFPAADAAAFADAMRRVFAGVKPRLLARGEQGWVRRVHGDLHLRNIVLIAAEPILFDAIEFDELIATTDVLYDFAFLLMDLWERQFRPQANLLLNRYLWGSSDAAPNSPDCGSCLSSWRCVRPCAPRSTRSVLSTSTARPGPATARLAISRRRRAFLAPAPLRLIAIGGLSGTGKTTLAARLAPILGRAPGAVHLRSDIERKRLLGVPELARLPESAYALEVTERVFAALRAQAKIALQAGHSVIVDAVHRDAGERREIAGIAVATGAAFTGLWLDAPLETIVARVATRSGDASDATAAVVVDQAKEPSVRSSGIASTHHDRQPSLPRKRWQ